jgi:O-antigen/teichoic acid export membrane protein
MNAAVEPPGKTVSESLAQSAFHALAWQYSGAIFQAGLQFTVGITLARLLTPEAFGIVGMALIAIGFAKLVGDMGFAAAIIQYPELTARHVRAAFTGSMLCGTLLFLLLWFLAPAVSRLFNHDALTPMLRVIGLSLIVSGMGVVSVALLRRELQFRLLAVIEIISYAGAFGVVGISMAVLGYGAWSLIVANIVQPICLLALAVPLGKQSIWPSLGVREYRDLYRVASAEMLNNIVNFTAENLHFLVTGKWLGAAGLGLMNRSFYLMHLPVQHFAIALWSVTFPLYAKIQGDIPRLGRAFLHTVSLTALVTIPVFFAMAVAPEVIVGGLLGEQWRPAAATFQILCMGGPFLAMLRVFGAVSHARGYVFSECGRQVIYLAFVAVALWLLFPFGLEGMAVAVTVAVIARYVLLACLSIRLAGVTWRQFLAAQVSGISLGIAVAVPVYITSTAGSVFIKSDVLMLVLIVAVSIVSLFLSFLLFPASWLGDLYPWLVDRFGPRLPQWLYELATAKLPATQCGAVTKNMEAEI